MIHRIIPHPILSLTLLLVWLGLVNTVSLGNLLLGAFLGLTVPMLTGAYWPNRPRLRRPLVVIEYILVVLWDIVVANVLVAKIIVFKKNDDIRSHWVNVPLELRSPEAITVLAGTITMTPGTVSASLSADGCSILVHCLHTDDPDAERDGIKQRYERRLMEIFRMIEVALLFAFACFGLGLLMCLWRLTKGPDSADRILALDTMVINVIALLILYGIWKGTAVYFEVSMLVAMVGFVSTVAYCRFVLRGDIIE